MTTIQFPPNIPILLDGRPVEKITAFLFPNGGNDDPQKLRANEDKSFIGSYVLGMGFTFDDTNPEATPIAEMHRLIEQNPKNAEVIFPYIGGEEVNSSPTHAHHRYVINFGEISEKEVRENYPDLMAIVEEKVKPGRISLPPKNNWNRTVASKWWLFGADRQELKRAIAGSDRVLVISRVGNAVAFTFLSSGMVYAETLVVFPLTSYSSLSILQGRIHEVWARFLSSSMKDDLRYSPSDSFETFPFPEETLTPSPSPRTGEGNKHKTDELTPNPPLTPPSPLVGVGGWGGEGLETIGKTYYAYRAALMVRNNQGLTDTYNRFHDPHEDDPEILKLRELHDQMDRAVLNAYGWQDIETTCGFTLDYLDIELEDLPTEIQDRMASGNLFFETPEEAVAFDVTVRTATTKKGKLPWRYKWPEAIHDEVLARLLALNQERYDAEVRLGLHRKTTQSKSKNPPPEAHQATLGLS